MWVRAIYDILFSVHCDEKFIMYLPKRKKRRFNACYILLLLLFCYDIVVVVTMTGVYIYLCVYDIVRIFLFCPLLVSALRAPTSSRKRFCFVHRKQFIGFIDAYSSPLLLALSFRGKTYMEIIR